MGQTLRQPTYLRDLDSRNPSRASYSFLRSSQFPRRYQVNASKLLLAAWLLLSAQPAVAQSVEKESTAVLELGGTGAWNFKDSPSSLGPSVAVEVTPIEKWLELEAGVTPLFRRHSTEWNTDLLFKKPWSLSKKVEFMIGIGPEWVHSNSYGVRKDSVAGEVVSDFMFWRSEKHRFGWYVEPGYDYSFSRGHERSLGMTGGILIAIP